MEFRILGPIEARDGDRVVPVSAGLQRTLLALLILRANEPIPSDRLIHELWGERPPSSAAKALQGHVSALRKLLDPDREPGAAGRLIVTRGSGYELRLERDQLDLGRFEQLRKEGRQALAQGEPERAAARLREALALWRGPPLADVADEPFAQVETARLEELRISTVEDRIDAELASGRHAELVAELEALVKERPLRELLRSQLMVALYRSGRQAEALAVYGAGRTELVEELGIEPGRALRELHQAILRQDPALDPASSKVSAAEPIVQQGVFVGREHELSELVAGLDHAFAGRGRLFLLAGEPGIGKSRLAEELIAHANARGARVLVGRCWEAGGAPAYWPWVQSLRTYIRDEEENALRAQLGGAAAELAQILPELHRVFPGLAEPPPLDSESARFRLFDATATFLRNASAKRPIVLFLDDLHAADAPSLLLLRFLVRELESTRMLVLGAYRDVDPIPERLLADLLAEVVREPSARRFALEGLSAEDVATYVGLTASALSSPELVAALYEETEGNPLFLGETVRLLHLERPTEARIAIPQSIRDVIGRRLTHLSDECNRVLVLASVLGREFGLDTLARVGAVSVDELLETLDDAMTARVISDVPGAPGRLRFAHVLIRDTLYAELTATRRARLHRLVVEALEARYGSESGSHLAELAHHATAGSDFGKALDYARLAGDRALAVLAYEEAARLYQTALDVLDLSPRSDERTRCDVLLSLGEAESRAGNALRSRTALFEAAAIARQVGLARELALAAVAFGGRTPSARETNDPRLVPLLEEALASSKEDDVELRSTLLARLAAALRDELRRDRRDGLSREAVELARSANDPTTLMNALEGRVYAILAPDTLGEAVAMATEILTVARRIGDRERTVHGHTNRVLAQVMAGDLEAVESDLEAAGRIARPLGQPAQIWDICAGEAMLALAAGRFEAGQELAERARELGERAAPEGALSAYYMHSYTLCDFRGKLEEVDTGVRELAAEHPARPVFRCVLAHLHARLGRLPEAKRELTELAEDDLSTLPFDQEWLFAMSFLAETAWVVTDTGSAEVIHRLLLPWAALNAADHPEGIRGSVARYLGLVATTLARWDDAERHFEAALAMNERMGVRPWLAHSQYDYGRMLLDRDRADDRERAGALLGAAFATYRDTGMEGHAASAAALAREAGYSNASPRRDRPSSA